MRKNTSQSKKKLLNPKNEVFNEYASESQREKFGSSLTKLVKKSTLQIKADQLKVKEGVTYINEIEEQQLEGPRYSSRPNKMSKRKYMRVGRMITPITNDQKL